MIVIRRATFELYPSKAVVATLHYHRRLHKELYNACVYHRKTEYQRFGKSVTYFDQQNCLPAFKECLDAYKDINSQALQATVKRVDCAFVRFFNGLSKYPRFKSIHHYRGWTYPATSGWVAHTTGINGYLELAKIGSIQMRGKVRVWGQPTTCTIVYHNGKWYASITLKVDDELLQRPTGTGAVGIDIGCKVALAITDGENHQFIDAPRFLRSSEKKIKSASRSKRRKRSPNRKKKIKASRRWKKAQQRVSKLTRKVANQRQNWVQQVATDIISSSSFVATEKLEVNKMTRKGKKRKRQKAGLNKSILDVGFGMLLGAIQYKVLEAGGVFVLVPTKQVKPTQTCSKCGHQSKKDLGERTHNCEKCGFTEDRDINAALVMLLWALGKLPGAGTVLADVDASSSTSSTKKRKFGGSMKQLGQAKRQKSGPKAGDAETPASLRPG